MIQLKRLATLMAATAIAASAGYKEEALGRLATLEKKFTTLAESIPADKYAWRPASGVRSISELFLHISAANYGVSRVFGTMPPQGVDLRGLEKSTTQKDEIVKRVRESFVHYRSAIEKLSADDAEKAMKMFGQQTTTRGAVWTTLEHLSEHLGQGIAYSRTNGVVPPWSE